jgi:hypothetical protein
MPDLFFVIPAKAGIHSLQNLWTPAFAGVTTYVLLLLHAAFAGVTVFHEASCKAVS